MRRLALLGLLVLAGCGSGADETALLGPGEASRLDQRIERVGELVAAGDCEGARRALSQYARQVDALPDRRDPELLGALRDGAVELESTIGTDCQEPEEEPETTETTTPEPTETTTEPEPTETVEPEPTETVEPEPTQTVPPPVDPPAGGEDGEGGAGDEGQGGGNGTEGGGNGTEGRDGGSGGVQAPGDDA